MIKRALMYQSQMSGMYEITIQEYCQVLNKWECIRSCLRRTINECLKYCNDNKINNNELLLIKRVNGIMVFEKTGKEVE